MIFPFDELNAAAFQNAQIYRMRKITYPKYQYLVHAPNEFRDMYFHSDFVMEIIPSPYVNYRDVMGYTWQSFMYSKFMIKCHPVIKWVIFRVVGRIHSKKAKLLNFLNASTFHLLPYWISASGRQRKFLVRTGIYRKLKLTSSNSIFLGVGSYFDFINHKPLRGHDERGNFQSSFLCLEYMITDHAVMTQEQIFFRSKIMSSELQPFQRVQYHEMLNFIKANTQVIFLRTRNKKLASIHNAPIIELTKIVEMLNAQGIAVINSGVPCMGLNLPNSELFLEISHDLPPIIAMEIGARCKAVMTSAGGDFFVGYASTSLPLILFDKEWSTSNLPDPVSIISARKSSGLIDLDVSDKLIDGNFGDCLDEIEKYIKSC